MGRWVRGEEWERFGVLTAEVGVVAAALGLAVVVIARRPPPVSPEEAAAWRQGRARLRGGQGRLPHPRSR